MNRGKKEELKRKAAARAGKSVEQVAELDRQDREREEIEGLIGKYHPALFPEHYDERYLSWLDNITIAEKGHPYKDEYAEFIARKRNELGVAPFTFPSQEGEGVSSYGFVRTLVEAGDLAQLEMLIRRYSDHST